MKILFITDLYPIKQSEKNTPLTLHNFVFEWIKQGHKVDVIKPNFTFNSFLRHKPFYPKGFYEYEGVKIFNVNYFTPFCFNFIKKLPKEFDFNNYDVVIAHMPAGIIFAGKLAQIIKKPLVCGVHSSDIEVLTNPVYKFYFQPQLKKAYKNAKKIACRSFVLQHKFNEILPELAEKTFVAPSGIELREGISIPPYKPLLANILSFNLPIIRHSKPDSLRVLTCANLIRRKNIDKLILAMKNLDNFELTIIGDGTELKNLKNIIKSIPNHQKIKFLGHLSHENVLDEMKKADVFVLPSINETFGMVYLEAMASGCATVCTKNDGIDGIIKDEQNGFLCNPTPESIKKTLLKIKNFEHIDKLLKNSLETVKHYTLEECAKNYLKEIL